MGVIYLTRFCRFLLGINHMKTQCERRCTRKSLSKEEYIKNKKNYGQAHCGGCHKPIFAHMETCEQFHDMDGILEED